MRTIQEQLQEALEHRKAGRFDVAIAQYQQLLSENPRETEVKKILGHTYREAGQLENALKTYEELIEIAPHMADAIYTWIGALYRRLLRHEEAIQSYKKALEIKPRNAGTYNNLGNVYCDLNRYEEAAQAFHAAIERDPNLSVAYNGLGIAYRHLKKIKEAFEYYKQAIRLNPAYPDPYVDMGVMLVDSEQYEEAEICFNHALKLNPRMALAYEGLGVILMNKKEMEKALTFYQQALSLNPHSATLYNNIGNCLQNLERFSEAQAALEKAIELDPDFAMAHHNMGVVFGKQKLFEKALIFYNKALERNPALSDSAFNRSLVWLTQGHFEQGWRDYDQRFHNTKDFPPRTFRQPMWDGSPLHGKRILVVSEQGLGDTLQFYRYLPLVKAKGGTVIFETFPELMPLLSQAPGVDEWRVRPTKLSDEGIDYDVYIYLMSLPHLFKTQVTHIPSIPGGLFVPSEKQSYWEQQLHHALTLKIGIAWASKTENPSSLIRSCRLQDFDTLGQLENITFYSLQKGDAEQQALNADLKLNLVHLSPDIHCLTDTAAIIQQLDLIITVDTVVAHLAATLGKPTWIILPYQSDWRWLTERNDSPWYPTVRLFRQDKPKQWPQLFENVKSALQDFQLKHAHGVTTATSESYVQ